MFTEMDCSNADTEDNLTIKYTESFGYKKSKGTLMPHERGDEQSIARVEYTSRITVEFRQ